MNKWESCNKECDNYPVEVLYSCGSSRQCPLIDRKVIKIDFGNLSMADAESCIRKVLKKIKNKDFDDIYIYQRGDNI